jgi:hypothetical protein
MRSRELKRGSPSGYISSAARTVREVTRGGRCVLTLGGATRETPLRERADSEEPGNPQPFASEEGANTASIMFPSPSRSWGGHAASAGERSGTRRVRGRIAPDVASARWGCGPAAAAGRRLGAPGRAARRASTQAVLRRIEVGATPNAPFDNGAGPKLLSVTRGLTAWRVQLARSAGGFGT